jgi:hypothetical protein
LHMMISWMMMGLSFFLSLFLCSYDISQLCQGGFRPFGFLLFDDGRKWLGVKPQSSQPANKINSREIRESEMEKDIHIITYTYNQSQLLWQERRVSYGWQVC